MYPWGDRPNVNEDRCSCKLSVPMTMILILYNNNTHRVLAYSLFLPSTTSCRNSCCQNTIMSPGSTGIFAYKVNGLCQYLLSSPTELIWLDTPHFLCQKAAFCRASTWALLRMWVLSDYRLHYHLAVTWIPSCGRYILHSGLLLLQQMSSRSLEIPFAMLYCFSRSVS